MYYRLTIAATDLAPEQRTYTSTHPSLDLAAEHLRGFMGERYDITADPYVHEGQEWHEAYGGFAWDTARADVHGGLFGRDEYGDLEYTVCIERMVPNPD